MLPPLFFAGLTFDFVCSLAAPLVLNATVLNGLGVTGEFVGPIRWRPGLIFDFSLIFSDFRLFYFRFFVFSSFFAFH